MKKLALIGCGGMVYDFIFEYTKGLDVRLCAISGKLTDCNRFSAMYHTPAVYADYRRLLEAERPDLVIAFPDDENKQTAVVRDCLNSGADVLCERPIFHNADEGEELIQLQKSTGHFVMPRYNRRYMPAYLSACRILSSEEFGKTVMYHSSFHAGAYSSDRDFIINHIGHHLDLARMLLGELTVLHVSRLEESDKKVAYNVVLEGSGGLLCNIQANSFLCPEYPMERVEISGSNGKLVLVENVRHLTYHQPARQMRDARAQDFLAEGGTRILSLNAAQLNNFTFYGFEEMLRTFTSCSTTGQKPPQDVEDALKTYALIESVLNAV